jgi:hypothetical protein
LTLYPAPIEHSIWLSQAILYQRPLEDPKFHLAETGQIAIIITLRISLSMTGSN